MNTRAMIAVCHMPARPNCSTDIPPTMAVNRIVPSGTAGTTTAVAVISIATMVHSCSRASDGP